MGRRRRTTSGPYLLHLEILRNQIPAEHAGRFPFNLPALRDLTELPFHPRVTFLVGENGTGKSTLMEMIAGLSGLNPEGGSRNHRFSTRASHSDLGEYARLAKAPKVAADAFFLRAESFYNLATENERLDEGEGGPPISAHYGGGSLHERSHGESFFALFRNRLGENGLYLMDEPEAALSPRRQLEFLATLHDLCRRGCQFVIATHSPIILTYPDAMIYVLDGEGIRETTYEETDHYQVTRGFLANPKRTLDVLLADESGENKGEEAG
jgi:predicted ATPase